MKKVIFKLIKKLSPILQSTGLQRMPPFKGLYNLLIVSVKPEAIKIQGQKMFLDPTDSLRLSINEGIEKFQTELFKKSIRKGDTVLDIGAHIGYYTLIAAKLVGLRGKVYAFEPQEERFSILSKNVRQNGYKNVTSIKKGVYDFNGMLNLPLLIDQKKITTDVIKLDDFFKGKRKVDVIKMDIDGAEVKALEGMISILREDTDIKLFIEFWPAGLEIFGTGSKKLLELLKVLGFKIYEIDEKREKIRLVSSTYLLEKYSPKIRGYKISYTNLYCAR